MRASLHSCGTSPVCIDLLKINANVSPISSLTSCKNLGFSSSIPGLLSVFSLFSCSTTFFLVNIICANPFPLSKHVCLGSGMLPKSSSVNTELKYILSTSAASSSSTITSSLPSSLFNGPTLSFLFCLLLTYGSCRNSCCLLLHFLITSAQSSLLLPCLHHCRYFFYSHNSSLSSQACLILTTQSISCLLFQFVKFLPSFVLCPCVFLYLTCYPRSPLICPFVTGYVLLNNLSHNSIKLLRSIIYFQTPYCTFQILFFQPISH